MYQHELRTSCYDVTRGRPYVRQHYCRWVNSLQVVRRRIELTADAKLS